MKGKFYILMAMLLCVIQVQAVKVVFRLDDPTVRYDSVNNRIMQMFVDRGVSLSVGVIPCDNSENAYVPNDSAYLALLNSPKIEVCLHGLTHQNIGRGEFRDIDSAEVERRIKKGVETLCPYIQRPIRTFIPPFNAFNEYLPEALKRNGINTISANLTWETFDYMSQDEEITYLPETLCELIGTEGISKAAQRCIFDCKEKKAVCVVMLHAYDFPDEKAFAQLDTLLNKVKRTGCECYTFASLHDSGEVANYERHRVNLRTSLLKKKILPCGVLYSMRLCNTVHTVNAALYALIALFGFIVLFFRVKSSKNKRHVGLMMVVVGIAVFLATWYNCFSPLMMLAMVAAVNVFTVPLWFLKVRQFLLKRVVSYYSKYALIYTLSSILIMVIWQSYEAPILAKFNKCIWHYIEKIEVGCWSQALICVFAIYALWVILYKNVRRRYIYNPNLVFVVAWGVIICGYYRIAGFYPTPILFADVTYADVLIGLGALYVLAAVVSYGIACVGQLIAAKRAKKHKGGLLNDSAIGSLDEDELDWDKEVGKLLNVIYNWKQIRPISIGINAPWGAGKTSFLNLLRESIDKEHYEVIFFNPRESKSASEIQEDFFQQLISTLSRFDGRAEHNLKKYMKALQIIDEKNIFVKALSVYTVLNKESYREKIKKICEKLPVKIVVIIDDFDRLMPDEINEVLKLISTNACFANFIFLTAFDKNIVNDILSKMGQSEDAYFTDKYFDLEYCLPIRSYDYIWKYFADHLCEATLLRTNDAQKLKQSIEENKDLFRTNLITIRDAKRMINQLMLDYQLLDMEVDVRDFLYVQLIKYKYPEEYRALANKEYVVEGGFGMYCLTENTLKSEDIKCLPILKQLFAEKEEDYHTDPYRRIYSSDSFNIYFYNKLYNELEVKEMRRIFDVDYEEIRSMIVEWQDGGHAEDISNYLQAIYVNQFDTAEQLKHYVAACCYLVQVSKGGFGQTALTRALYKPVLEENREKLNLDIEQYKEFVMSIISNKDNDPYYKMMSDMNYLFVHGVHDEDGCIIKRTDIWPLVKARNLELLNGDEITEISAYDCITHSTDHRDTKKKIVMDKECCAAYRRYLDRHPDLYVGSFVGTTRESSLSDWNYVSVNAYYPPIFESDENLITFMETCKQKGVVNAQRAINFMQLYIANEHQPVEFKEQGEVQEKIDSDFVVEIEQLNQLCVLHDQMKAYKKKIDKNQIKKRETILKKVADWKLQLSKIPLYIKFREKILAELTMIEQPRA